MKIGVFCSGGDAPGMNACVRAVVRAAHSYGHEVVGIMRGYQGLINESFFIDSDGESILTPYRVTTWAAHGGAHLRSSRSEAFREIEGRQQAVEVLKRNQIEALIDPNTNYRGHYRHNLTVSLEITVYRQLGPRHVITDNWACKKLSPLHLSPRKIDPADNGVQ